LISSYPPILFEKDQDTVSPEELRKLDGLIKLLKDNGTVRIIVEGHADDGCSQECSLMLAYRRGEAVVEVLKAAGIAASRISRVSYGKERPACRADIEYCRPQNRRVQFRRGL
jgi:peptidoglycan-associated lipoprotein